MSGPLGNTAQELRRAFDESFASPVAQETPDCENLLAIRVAENPYAVRVRDLVRVVSGPRILAVPSRLPELIGIAGLRGILVPVYDLAALMGHAVKRGEARWLLVCGANEPLALAFGAFEGHLKVPRSALSRAVDHRRRHIEEAAQTGDGVRAILDVPSIVEAIRNVQH